MEVHPERTADRRVETRVVDLVEEVLERAGHVSEVRRACRGGSPSASSTSIAVAASAGRATTSTPVIERSVLPSCTASNIECSDGDVVWCTIRSRGMRPSDYEQARAQRAGPCRVTLRRAASECSTGGLDDHSVDARRWRSSSRALTLRSAALVAVPATEAGAAAANAAAGIGTAGGEEQPAVRPDDRRIKIPAYLASVCVKPWKDGRQQRRRDVPGRHQGHGQGRGVRPAESISRRTRPPVASRRRTGRPVSRARSRTRSSTRNRRSTVATSSGAARSSTTSSPTRAPTRPRSGRTPSRWPRRSRSRSSTASGGTGVLHRDRQAQDRDGLRLDREATRPTSHSSRTDSPATTPTSQAKNVATWLGKQIAGKKAQFAGDPDFQKQTRKFGLLYTISATTGPAIDLDNVQAAPRQAGRAQARGRGRVDPARRLLVAAPRRRRRRSRHRRSSRS